MKLFSFFILTILIAITSCDPKLSLDLDGDWDFTLFTRNVIVQTEDGTRCTNARLIRERNPYDIMHADTNGIIPIAYSSLGYSNSQIYTFTIYKTYSDTPKWQGNIECYKGEDFKEFFVTFPNAQIWTARVDVKTENREPCTKALVSVLHTEDSQRLFFADSLGHVYIKNYASHWNPPTYKYLECAVGKDMYSPTFECQIEVKLGEEYPPFEVIIPDSL